LYYDKGYIRDIQSGGYLYVTLEQFYIAWLYCLLCLYSFTTCIPY